MKPDGFKPEKFKPPQLKIDDENRGLVFRKGLELELNWNQFFHRVYHCNDTGVFKNWWIDVF